MYSFATYTFVARCVTVPRRASINASHSEMRYCASPSCDELTSSINLYISSLLLSAVTDLMFDPLLLVTFSSRETKKQPLHPKYHGLATCAMVSRLDPVLIWLEVPTTRPVYVFVGRLKPDARLTCKLLVIRPAAHITNYWAPLSLPFRLISILC